MGRALMLGSFLVGITAIGIYHIFFRCTPPPLPDLDLDFWWGPLELQPNQDRSIRPFKIEFNEAMVKDLRERLRRAKSTKFTPALEGVRFQYGFHSNYLQEVLEYWQHKYDFNKRQEFLNQYPQYKTNIQGLDIHFLRITPGKDVSRNTNVLPVLLLHGWPGSVREFYETIPYLTKHAQKNGLNLELVIPSLPGYGFSSPAVRPGLGAAEVAVVMRNLMDRLGHKTYYVQGGDWGSIIGSHMATLFSREVLGYHTNLPYQRSTKGTLLTTLGALYPPFLVESHLVERMYPLSKYYSFLIEEMGYFHLQATKPDTIGAALVDSPAGLAAYILEKFSTWTNRNFKELPDGGLTKKFSLDALIDNLMVYWSSQSITTSMRLYSETFNIKQMAYKLEEIPTSVPTAAIQARYEISYVPPMVLKLKYHNLVRIRDIDDGGHFLALEKPQLFAEDVADAIKAIEDYRQNNS